MMDVLLLGSGSADGWPNPFCTCGSCTAERLAGRVRGQTCALVDGTVLLDCGPETARAAARAGVDLAGLRHVLLTHRHPDRCAPVSLLFGSRLDDRPLDVLGPEAAVEDCRASLGPESTVRFLPVSPGDRVDLGGYQVRVLAARHGPPGSSVLYDVSAAGGRLLYAADAGPLPEETLQAIRDRRYDHVLLGETFGDRVGPGTGHLDLPSFGEQVRRLREVGAVTADTDLVAVRLSHHNPPTPELSRRLAAWGARVIADGSRLTGPQGAPRAAADERVRRTLVIGGARSGKSREAERLLTAEPEVTYVATSYPTGSDEEWDQRVRQHRADRPAHWRTEETLDLVGLLTRPGEPLLVDCLTLWLTRIMDHHQAWDDGAWAARAERAVATELDDLVRAWRGARRRVVAVTNEVGQGVVPDTAAGRRFRDLMGRLNARLAAETEDVRWCVAGRVSRL